jgi:DNA-binding transcriptional LysR family regulator
VTTFLNVCRTGSITGAARELGVTPSQVSKAITRLEAALHARLITRGARGSGLSAMGRQLLPRLQQVVSLMQSVTRVDGPPDGEITIAAPSSLLPFILPHVINALPRMRVRGLELPAELLRSYSADDLFDAAVLPGGMTGLPSKWANVRIGELRKSLFASPQVAAELGPAPTMDQIRARPFVGPVARDGSEFVQSSDNCPLSASERTLGSEVATMDVALRVAASCGQLVFGPVIAAEREVAEGTLVELQVPGWNVSEEVFLACDVERVLARVQTRIVSAVRAALFDVPDTNGEEEESSAPAAASLKGRLRGVAREGQIETTP